MLKVRKLANNLKNLPLNTQSRNSYSFTHSELDIAPAPKSMFMTHLVSVAGGSSMMVAGTAMTATSVLEWGIPLIAASIASISAPFVVRKKRRDKYREEIQSGFNKLLPQVITHGAPQINLMQATALDEGRKVEIPIAAGGMVSLSFGSSLSKNPEIAGTVYLLPTDTRIEDFDRLLGNLKDSNADIATALSKANNMYNRKGIVDRSVARLLGGKESQS